MSDGPPSGERFGKYVRTEKVGAGGMGEVWKAWDTGLERWVALKFLNGGDEQELARFKREAQLAGQLSHPNIAAIYEVGEAQGRHYIAMQFVEGRTAGELRQGERKLLVRLMRDAARAVAFAHEQGIVHRDLKPDNVMVTTRRKPATGRFERGQAAEHHVYVMDFGLARATSSAPGLSVSGMIVGTPAYMSPEQARGERADGRADVYGLGATLYELLTGRPPFEGANALEVLCKVVAEEPQVPSRIDPRIDADLETIVLRCLEKDPARRYAGATELAEDLERYLDGEPIAARRASVAYRLRKMVVKRKGFVALGAGGLLLTGVVAWVLGSKWMQARGEVEALKELGVLWAQVVLAKQGLHNASEDPGRVYGKIREAVGRVDDYIKRHPRQPQGYYVKARALLYLNDLAGAGQGARRSVELERDFAPGHALRGRVLLEQYGRDMHGPPATLAQRLRRLEPLLKEAEAELAKGAEGGSFQKWGLLKTREDEVVEIVAQALLTHYVGRDADGAVRLLRDADRAEPSEEYRVWLARWSESADEKIRWNMEALARMPHCAEAYFGRAAGLRQKGDLEAAIQDYSRALEISPRFADAYVNRGTARGESGDRAGAIDDLTLALAIDARNATALANRANVRRLDGDLEGAMEDCNGALAIDPDYASAYAARAETRRVKGDLDGAIRDGTRALELDPRHTAAWTARGRAREQKGDLDGAIADHSQAIEIDPRYGYAYTCRSAARGNKGDLDGAWEDCTRAIELNPRDDVAYTNRSGVRSMRGDIRGAIEDLTRALEIDPRSSYASARRGGERLRINDLDGAIGDYTRALEVDSGLMQAHAGRGEARRRKAMLLDRDGRHDEALLEWDRAIEDCSRALEIDPRQPQPYLARGAARHAKGDVDAAAKDYQRALDVAPPGWPEADTVRGLLESARRH